MTEKLSETQGAGTGGARGTPEAPPADGALPPAPPGRVAARARPRRNFALPVSVHPWSLVALLCLLAAVVFWWRSQPDATFVAAALGVVAWFLNVRGQIRRRGADEDANFNGKGGSDADDG